MSLVSFRDVQKSYRSLQGAEYVAVEHFSLEIEAGEFFCLLGPSGCGKTTVLKMLAGFEGPTAGQIVMEGRPVTAASRAVSVWSRPHGSEGRCTMPSVWPVQKGTNSRM